MAKRGLGKGLDALLPRFDVDNSSEILDISIDRIDPNKSQPRKNFEEKALQDLSQSIKKHGIISPIIVCKSRDRYSIIAGERRYRAAHLAGLNSIPCIVLDADSEKRDQLALIENLQREDLNPLEQAEAYKKLMNEYSYTQEELSEALSISRSSIANLLRILSLSPSVKELLARGDVSLGHAKLLVGLDEEKQKLVADAVVSRGLSVRSLEKLLTEDKNSKPKKAAPQKLDADMAEFERKLKLFFGKSSKISGNSKKGKIVLSYNSTDELNNIYNIINKL